MEIIIPDLNNRLVEVHIYSTNIILLKLQRLVTRDPNLERGVDPVWKELIYPFASLREYHQQLGRIPTVTSHQHMQNLRRLCLLCERSAFNIQSCKPNIEQSVSPLGKGIHKWTPYFSLVLVLYLALQTFMAHGLTVKLCITTIIPNAC